MDEDSSAQTPKPTRRTRASTRQAAQDDPEATPRPAVKRSSRITRATLAAGQFAPDNTEADSQVPFIQKQAPS